MLKKFVQLIGGDPNKRDLERCAPIVAQINQLENQFAQLSSEELAAKTSEFRRKLASGIKEYSQPDDIEKNQESILDTLLPEAYAAVREASKRTLGLRHYDVQMIGGIVLHQGKISEMRTGEGKTLVATLPLYLNALKLNPAWVERARRRWGREPEKWTFNSLDNLPVGRGVHLVTVNDYLARRDARWMGPIYHALGLSVATLQDGGEAYIFEPDYAGKNEMYREFRPVPRHRKKFQESLTPDRSAAYNCDVLYGTNSEFGFDYLRDHLAWDRSDWAQRGHPFALVDEVDNVLIDQARTPLIISGPSHEDPALYQVMAQVMRQLRPEDYEVDEKGRSVSLTNTGETHIEELLRQKYRVRVPAGFNIGSTELEDGDDLQRENWYLREELLVRYYASQQQVQTSRRHGNIRDREREADHEIQVLDQDEYLTNKDRPEELSPKQQRLFHYIDIALQAQFIQIKGKDYLTQGKRVVIIDPFTGRLMPDRRWSEGLHQAVEAKENVDIQRESITYASISLQNYFRLYKKLGGMSGTAASESEEFNKTYNLGVVTIPTNLENRLTQPDSRLSLVEASDEQGYKYQFYASREQPKTPIFFKRKDYPDVVYRTEEAKLRAIAREILKYYTLGRPLLVGTTSVENSEHLSARLQPEMLWRLMQVFLFRLIWMRDNKREEDGRMAPELLFLYEPLEKVLPAEMNRKARELHIAFRPSQNSAEDLELMRQILEIPAGTNLERLEKALHSGIPHQVLNARKHTEESQIIAGAGAFGAVTIATSMAGRGVDIKLGGELPEETLAMVGRILRRNGYPEPFNMSLEEMYQALSKMQPEAYGLYPEEIHKFLKYMRERDQVRTLGGLHVIGSERHEARRIDNQLRGRAARQGDPGSSRFYLSLEDDLMRRFGGQQADGLMQRFKIDDALPLEAGLVNRIIEQAQNRVEGQNFDIRKHLLEYDDVLNVQRTKMYDQRDRIVHLDDLKENIWRVLEEQVDRQVANNLAEDPLWRWRLVSWLDRLGAYLVALCEIRYDPHRQIEYGAHLERRSRFGLACDAGVYPTFAIHYLLQDFEQWPAVKNWTRFAASTEQGGSGISREQMLKDLQDTLKGKIEQALAATRRQYLAELKLLLDDLQDRSRETRSNREREAIQAFQESFDQEALKESLEPQEPEEGEEPAEPVLAIQMLDDALRSAQKTVGRANIRPPAFQSSELRKLASQEMQVFSKAGQKGRRGADARSGGGWKVREQAVHWAESFETELPYRIEGAEASRIKRAIEQRVRRDTGLPFSINDEYCLAAPREALPSSREDLERMRGYAIAALDFILESGKHIYYPANNSAAGRVIDLLDAAAGHPDGRRPGYIQPISPQDNPEYLFQAAAEKGEFVLVSRATLDAEGRGSFANRSWQVLCEGDPLLFDPDVDWPGLDEQISKLLEAGLSAYHQGVVNSVLETLENALRPQERLFEPGPLVKQDERINRMFRLLHLGRMPSPNGVDPVYAYALQRLRNVVAEALTRAKWSNRMVRQMREVRGQVTYYYLVGEMLKEASQADLQQPAMEYIEGFWGQLRSQWGEEELWTLSAQSISQLAPEIQQIIRSALEQVGVNTSNKEIDTLPLVDIFAVEDQHQGEAIGIQCLRAVRDALGERLLTEMHRYLLLSSSNQRWLDYLTEIEGVRLGVGLESYAQRDPLTVYKSRAKDAFDNMMQDIASQVTNALFHQWPMNDMRALRERGETGVEESFLGAEQSDEEATAQLLEEKSQEQEEPDASLRENPPTSGPSQDMQASKSQRRRHGRR
jgi:preprotein translocase subunit SecA